MMRGVVIKYRTISRMTVSDIVTRGIKNRQVLKSFFEMGGTGEGRLVTPETGKERISPLSLAV